MRFPRPNRFRRVSVCPLPCKLGVGEATANRLHHGKGESVFIGERVILRGSVIEPENLLCDIAVKMERLNRDIGSFQAAFQQAPEVLNSLSMHLPTNVLFQMVHNIVNEFFTAKVVVSRMLIGVDLGILLDVRQNLILQGLALDVGDYASPNLPSLTVPHPHDNRLGSGSLYALPLVLLANARAMHVLNLAADISFIDLDRTAVRTAHLDEGSAFHCLANPVKHEPCRLLGNANSAVKFVTADPVFAVADHPHCRHPLVQPNRGILKDRADLDGELPFATIAEPQSARLHKRVRVRAATGAGNLVFGPTEPLRILESSVWVTEVNYCLLESYGLFHLSHLLSKTRIPRFDLCVKYINAKTPRLGFAE